MKKSLIYAGAVLTLAAAVLIPANYATAKMNNGRVPHIDGNVQFPPYARWQLIRYTFRLHIPQNSKAITQLIINVPNNVTISADIKNIDIVNENGQKINTNISVNSKTVSLAFLESVAPNTKLDIDLKNVKRSTLGNSVIYRFSAKFVGSDEDIPIGIAQFRIY
ncbi:hypothetical protein DP113_33255 (plasmid) [Brasilonema octagenarum UFV-E1]|uniref:DUF2808 domain-containing protein n=2 Tax=Brasilonema TaxID=383614 RepID=A0A856MSJ2_9CYAN|nr:MULTISPECIES: DUF2808 domain-containing protein [Brasilonema]NMF61672.1 hypothetical protein [Brasilonema octagenarum UFV-OR1]QDL12607.1 hypothetical protein DP114_33150 [Brasilonema sennae CENA114]QDL19002.1 hypothetical protein DP113_33255 [Brasilonema octagenarum UFV-E1]